MEDNAREAKIADAAAKYKYSLLLEQQSAETEHVISRQIAIDNAKKAQAAITVLALIELPSTRAHLRKIHFRLKQGLIQLWVHHNLHHRSTTHRCSPRIIPLYGEFSVISPTETT